jgi:hypothetical protein
VTTATCIFFLAVRKGNKAQDDFRKSSSRICLFWFDVHVLQDMRPSTQFSDAFLSLTLAQFVEKYRPRYSPKARNECEWRFFSHEPIRCLLIAWTSASRKISHPSDEVFPRRRISQMLPICRWSTTRKIKKKGEGTYKTSPPRQGQSTQTSWGPCWRIISIVNNGAMRVPFARNCYLRQSSVSFDRSSCEREKTEK